MVAFPVLDVATVLALAQWIGIPLTLLLLLVSTALGLFACGKKLSRMAKRAKELKQEYGAQLPPDVVVVQGGEIFVAFFAMLCFLFPGFLSDAVGFLLSIPYFERAISDQLLKAMKQNAALQGKTLEEYFQDSKGCRRA